MKFTFAIFGTRGDIEPAAAVACELRRRGHTVSMAVPPNLVGLVKQAGLGEAAAYGPDSVKQLDAEVFRKWRTLRNPLTVIRQARAYVMDGWADMSETLAELAGDADAVVSGTPYQEVAANVAEAKGIPFAALHVFPARANPHILPVRLPAAFAEAIWPLIEWAFWRLLKEADDAQRRVLGLPPSRVRSARRIVQAGTLEIQIYDKIFFPGLEEYWGGRRPVVGMMSLELGSPDDEAVRAWIAKGRPPIYLGFGSMPVHEPAGILEMFIAACREMGERALICTGEIPPNGIAGSDDVMVVPTASHAAIFPLCRATVHHGGAGTTAASLRAGVPVLALWVGADQPLWSRRVKRLGAGTSYRLSKVTPRLLRDGLQTVLDPACAARARAAGARMTPLRDSVIRTADLLEGLATRRSRC